MTCLCDYSFDKAKDIIAENPRVICAVSAPEPIQYLPLNINEFITQKITEKVSQKTGIPVIPPILQGIITPFKPYAPVGTHHKRFCGLISDTALSLSAAGIKEIIFIVSSNLFVRRIDEGINDYKRKLPADFSCRIISWQNAKIVSDTLNGHFENLLEYWRKESAVFLLANELKGIEIPYSLPNLPFSKEDFIRWKKRGSDPEKLKKLSPDFRFSYWSGFIPLQCSLFEGVCDELSKL